MKCKTCKKVCVSAQNGSLWVCLEHGVQSPNPDGTSATEGNVVPKTGIPAVRSKHGNRKTEVDGILFDSKHEAYVCDQLRLRVAAGEIFALKLQVPFLLEVNGQKVCKYIADFVYDEYRGCHSYLVVADAKSEHTKKLPVYRLKRALMKACLGIDILEL